MDTFLTFMSKLYISIAFYAKKSLLSKQSLELSLNLHRHIELFPDSWFSDASSATLFLLGAAPIRAGKSSKMSERGLLLGVKCPRSCIKEILQNCQVYRSIHHFQPQIKLVYLISTNKWGFWSSFLNNHLNHQRNLQSGQMCGICKPECPQF